MSSYLVFLVSCIQRALELCMWPHVVEPTNRNCALILHHRSCPLVPDENTPNTTVLPKLVTSPKKILREFCVCLLCFLASQLVQITLLLHLMFILNSKYVLTKHFKIFASSTVQLCTKYCCSACVGFFFLLEGLLL